MRIALDASRIAGAEGLIPQTRMKPRADGGARTRDLRLGKPTLYQLSYVREACIVAGLLRLDR